MGLKKRPANPEMMPTLGDGIDKQTLDILKSIFKSKNRNWDKEYNRFVYSKPADLSQEQWDLIPENLRPNNYETLTHDEVVIRIKKSARALTVENVTDGFILSCSGSWPRGSQTLISWAYARHLKEHAFDNPSAHLNPKYVCLVCGVCQETTWDRSREIVGRYSGAAWNEMPADFVVDLEERSTVATPKVTKKDKTLFVQLLRTIDKADDKETPSKLAERLCKDKRFPGKNKYSWRGKLQALAEVGVLPNPIIDPKYDRLASRTECWALSSGTRSDIVLPFSGWRGAQGINWERAKLLFPKVF